MSLAVLDGEKHEGEDEHHEPGYIGHQASGHKEMDTAEKCGHFTRYMARNQDWRTLCQRKDAHQLAANKHHHSCRGQNRQGHSRNQWPPNIEGDPFGCAGRHEAGNQAKQKNSAE